MWFKLRLGSESGQERGQEQEQEQEWAENELLLWLGCVFWSELQRVEAGCTASSASACHMYRYRGGVYSPMGP